MSEDSLSPWITQLRRQRPVSPISDDFEADVAVIGGGIAGMATAYHVLRDTTKSVILVEMDKVGHGSSGHNAGQVVAGFERPLTEIAEELGIKEAAEAQRALVGAWDLLYRMIEETGSDPGLEEITCYLGQSSVEGVVHVLREKELRDREEVPFGQVFLAEDRDLLGQIPDRYRTLYLTMPHSQLLSKLRTKDPRYLGMVAVRAGVMNSALFCEQLAHYLLEHYPDRFDLFEGSKVRKLRMGDWAVLRVNEHTVVADDVVLCTNGYREMRIEACDTPAGEGAVNGVVGFMVGYLGDQLRGSEALVYFQGKEDDAAPYYYLTRRTFDEGVELTTVGGPERWLGDKERYDPQENYLPGVYDIIDDFYARISEDGKRERSFAWKGVMGYTDDGVRIIGPDPSIPGLLYNLGCNGIGILPSIYGGKRIADILGGKKLAPTLFDPRTNLRLIKVEEK